MRPPKLLVHIFDSESKTVSFGWWVFIMATYGAFFALEPGRNHTVDADTWLWCVGIASTLIGGKLIGETILQARLGKTAPKEAPPDAPAAPPPAS